MAVGNVKMPFVSCLLFASTCFYVGFFLMTRNKKPPPFAEGVWGWVSFALAKTRKNSSLHTDFALCVNFSSLRENPQGFSWQSIIRTNGASFWIATHLKY